MIACLTLLVFFKAWIPYCLLSLRQLYVHPMTRRFQWVSWMKDDELTTFFRKNHLKASMTTCSPLPVMVVIGECSVLMNDFFYWAHHCKQSVGAQMKTSPVGNDHTMLYTTAGVGLWGYSVMLNYVPQKFFKTKMSIVRMLHGCILSSFFIQNLPNPCQFPGTKPTVLTTLMISQDPKMAGPPTPTFLDSNFNHLPSMLYQNPSMHRVCVCVWVCGCVYVFTCFS